MAATSRLLFSYPNETVSAILDLLFLPQYGASVHHLKVEIGGDGQSSEGVEPSHLHTDDKSAVNYNRGYEWQLMTEARKRNPAILLSGLAWTWPGWVGAGTHSPWTDVNRSVTYIISWMEGARDVYGLDLNYINADWNERGWSPIFVKALRKAMDAAGFASVGIVCGDDSHVYSCASEAATDPELRAAIVALGSHGPLGNASYTELPLWNTEVHAPEPGGTDLASIFSVMYMTQNITSGTLWNILSAYNPGLFSPDWGLFRAWWPWCGHYEQDGKLWVFAHHTQATGPGWHWLQRGAGTGALAGGMGQYVSFVEPTSNAFTILIYKPATAPAENATFTLYGSISESVTVLHAVRSSVVANGHLDPNVSEYFVLQPDIHISQDSHAFALLIQPGDMWTLTTVQGMRKGTPSTPPPPATPFPAVYEDNFDSCPISQEASYFTDMTGVFECVSAAPGQSGGTVMQQMVPMHPIAWRPEEQRPFSLFAANISWQDVDASISVSFSQKNESAMLGARANPNCCGRVITGEDLMPGCWFWVSQSGTWALYNAVQNVSTHTGIIAHGSLPVSPQLDAWHSLRLVISANMASGYFDALLVFANVDVVGLVPPEGFVGLGTGDWGQYVRFDNFAVKCTSC